MARGCDLLEKTLMPAIREIEKLCGLSVSVRLEREPRHGTLTKLTFKLPLDGGKPSRRDLSVDSRVPALPGETAGGGCRAGRPGKPTPTQAAAAGGAGDGARGRPYVA